MGHGPGGRTGKHREQGVMRAQAIEEHCSRLEVPKPGANLGKQRHGVAPLVAERNGEAVRREFAEVGRGLLEPVELAERQAQRDPGQGEHAFAASGSSENVEELVEAALVVADPEELGAIQAERVRETRPPLPSRRRARRGSQRCRDPRRSWPGSPVATPLRSAGRAGGAPRPTWPQRRHAGGRRSSPLRGARSMTGRRRPTSGRRGPRPARSPPKVAPRSLRVGGRPEARGRAGIRWPGRSPAPRGLPVGGPQRVPRSPGDGGVPGQTRIRPRWPG